MTARIVAASMLMLFAACTPVRNGQSLEQAYMHSWLGESLETLVTHRGPPDAIRYIASKQTVLIDKESWYSNRGLYVGGMQSAKAPRYPDQTQMVYIYRENYLEETGDFYACIAEYRANHAQVIIDAAFSWHSPSGRNSCQLPPFLAKAQS